MNQLSPKAFGVDHPRTCREDLDFRKEIGAQRNDGNAQFSLCYRLNAGRLAVTGIFLLPLAITNRHSTFGNSDMGREHAILSVFFWSGGIAQLVERQLCKLEVRGSNPLASSLRSQRSGERRLSRRSLGKADVFDLATSTRRATTRQANGETWRPSSTSISCRATATRSDCTLA